MPTKTMPGKEYYQKARDDFTEYARDPAFKLLPTKIQQEFRRLLDIIEAIVLCGITRKLVGQCDTQIDRVRAMLKEHDPKCPAFKNAGWRW